MSWRHVEKEDGMGEEEEEEMEVEDLICIGLQLSDDKEELINQSIKVLEPPVAKMMDWKTMLKISFALVLNL